MRSPCPEFRPNPDGPQDTREPSLCPDAIRDNLAVDNDWLDRNEPEVLDLAAESIRCQGDVLRGRISRLGGARSAEYRRGQMIGRKPITRSDDAWLAIHEPEALCAALRPILAAAGRFIAGADVAPTIARHLERAPEDVDGLERYRRFLLAELADADRSLEAQRQADVQPLRSTADQRAGRRVGREVSHAD
jgi:hypothetical protein